MNVLYTLDKGFEPQLVVSLSSLIENTVGNLNVFIIYDGIDQKSYQFLKNFESKRVKITFLKAPQISKKLIPDRGAKNQFYRLYIPEIFKKYSNINRVLYLDCDTLITKKGLEDLFKIEMGGYAIAATVDPWGIHYKHFFNLEKDTNMFNDGIFLIDFENWQKKKYSEKLKKIISRRKHFIQADQGLLNEMIHGEFKILEPRFNAISSYFEMSYDELMIYRKPVNFYSAEQIKMAVNDPVIVHFTSTFLCNRPWQKGSKHKFKNKWISMLKKLNCDQVKILNLNDKQRFMKSIFEFLPRKFSVFLFGILQAYVRPLKFYLF